MSRLTPRRNAIAPDRVADWSPTQTYSPYTQQLRAFSWKQAFMAFRYS
ncbi:hypothetical protein [Nostoc sp.]